MIRLLVIAFILQVAGNLCNVLADLAFDDMNEKQGEILSVMCIILVVLSISLFGVGLQWK